MGPAWLARQHGDSLDLIGAHGTVGQVDPLRLCGFLLEQCQSRGVHLHQPAKAISIARDDQHHLSGVRIQDSQGHESDLDCTRLVLAAGVWTPRVFKQLFPSSKFKVPISSIAGHSIVLRSPNWTEKTDEGGCHAVFTTARSGFSPELFSRIGGDLYVAGLNSSTIPVPELPTDAKIDQDSINQLKRVTARLLGSDANVDGFEVTRQGLCFRPATPWGNAVISKIPEDLISSGHMALGNFSGNVYLACGHGPWGISLSLGTGKVVSDMLRGQTTSADVSSLAL